MPPRVFASLYLEFLSQVRSKLAGFSALYASAAIIIVMTTSTHQCPRAGTLFHRFKRAVLARRFARAWRFLMFTLSPLLLH
jgi:hypothetical protein